MNSGVDVDGQERSAREAREIEIVIVAAWLPPPIGSVQRQQIRPSGFGLKEHSVSKTKIASEHIIRILNRPVNTVIGNKDHATCRAGSAADAHKARVTVLDAQERGAGARIAKHPVRAVCR